MKIQEETETTGIKRILIVIMIISAFAYLLGRLFYVPPKYCYIDKVGYRTLDVCEQHKKFKARLPDIYKATESSIQLIESWYYTVYEKTRSII